VLTLEIKF